MIGRRTTLHCGLLAGLAMVTGLPMALAQSEGQSQVTVPPRLRAFFSDPRWVGGQRFTYWGFDVYDASLWANVSFAPEDWARQDLILELRYLRDFKGLDIAQRSVDEIHKQRALSAEKKQKWFSALQALIPDVRSGERLTGVYTPGKGMKLLHQDRTVGEVADAELAQRFFGIWLAAETSQRQLRQRLLAGAQQ